MAEIDDERMRQLLEADPSTMNRAQRQELVDQLAEIDKQMDEEIADDLRKYNANLETIKNEMATFPTVERGEGYVRTLFNGLLSAYEMLSSGAIDDFLDQHKRMVADTERRRASLLDKKVQAEIIATLDKSIKLLSEIKGAKESKDVMQFIGSEVITKAAFHGYFKKAETMSGGSEGLAEADKTSGLVAPRKTNKVEAASGKAMKNALRSKALSLKMEPKVADGKSKPSFLVRAKSGQPPVKPVKSTQSPSPSSARGPPPSRNTAASKASQANTPANVTYDDDDDEDSVVGDLDVAVPSPPATKVNKSEPKKAAVSRGAASSPTPAKATVKKRKPAGTEDKKDEPPKRQRRSNGSE